jgi:hypothetical protein
MPQFDTIVIGSSPLFMLEALVRAICGEKVLVLEKNSFLGGAWGVSSHFGYELDSGVHLLYKVPYWKSHAGLYRWVAGLSNTKFSALKPQPYGDVRAGFISPPELSFGSSKPIGLLGSIKNLATISYTNIRYLLGDRYMFPSKGTGRWVKNLEEQLVKYGCSIKISTRVQSVDIDDNGCVITDCDGNHCSGHSVVMSKRVHLDKMVVNGSCNSFTISKAILYHCFILIESETESCPFIWKVLDDQIVFAMADLSFTVCGNRKLPKGQRIVAFALQKGVHTKEVEPRLLLDLLKRRKIVDFSSKVLSHEFSAYETLESIPDSHSLPYDANRLEILSYDNMTRGLQSRAPDWEGRLRSKHEAMR